MTTRDKIGLGILIALFIALCAILVLTIRPLGPGHDPKDSIFIQQRMKNLQK